MSLKNVQKNTRKQINEEYLFQIPVLGYFFRKIKNNQEAIEKAFKTGKKIEGKTKESRFLLGIFKIVSTRWFRSWKIK